MVKVDMWIIFLLTCAQSWITSWSPLNYPTSASPTLCSMPTVSALCDPDNVLSSEMKAVVSDRLEEIRKEAPVNKICNNPEAQWEIAIALVRRLDRDFVDGHGRTKALQMMAKHVHDTWGVGDAACQSGVVLFLSVEDRFMHFSTGRGAKSVLPNSILKQIMDRMKSKLRAKDEGGALLLALDDIERVIEKGYITNPIWDYLFWGVIICFVAGFLYYSHLRNQRYREVRRRLTEMERREAENLETRFDIDSCMICFEEFPTRAEEKNEKTRLLRCGHRFCKGCIQSWIDEGHDTCPLCRKKIGGIDDDDNDDPPPNQPINRNGNYFSDSWGNCSASSPHYSTYNRTLRQHRFRRMRHRYPGILTDAMIRTWTRPGYNGGYARHNLFRQANPANSSGRSNSSGGRSFSGGSSRGGSGTGSGW